MSFDVLPWELTAYIVTWNFKVFKHFVMKLPAPTRDKRIQAAAQVKFLEITTVDGITRHRAGGKLHRIDGPAQYCVNGCNAWFVRGRIHRRGDLPTMTRVRPCAICDGHNELITGEPGALYTHRQLQYVWLQNSRLHRDCGPAMITTYGAKQWFKHSKPHRDSGPCIKCPMGCRAWAIDGTFYCTNDEPCISLSRDCTQCEFYCVIITNSERNRVSILQTWCNDLGLFNRSDGPAVISRTGTQIYMINGVVHRDGGPAIICSNGSAYWYQHGVLHRDDGPAIILPNGDQFWYKNGKAYRDDGPAEIHGDGGMVWRRAGKMHRDGDPAVILPDGSRVWYQDGLRHRDDGPALITQHVEKWYQHGLLHRTDGPAVIRSSGHMEFYCNGVCGDTLWPSVIYRRERMIWYKDNQIHRDDGPAIVCRAGCRHWYSHGVELFTYVGHEHIDVTGAIAHAF